MRRARLRMLLMMCVARRPDFFFFFFKNPAPPKISPLPLHAALPIKQSAHDPAVEAVWQPDREVPDGDGHHHPDEHAHRRPCLFRCRRDLRCLSREAPSPPHRSSRSEEHTPELPPPCNLVCRLLLVKK